WCALDLQRCCGPWGKMDCQAMTPPYENSAKSRAFSSASLFSKKHEGIYSASRSVWLRPLSSNTFTLVNAAVSAPRPGWRGDPSGKGRGDTKAGVILDDLLPEADRPRDARLMDGLDAINNRLGKKTVVLACEGFAGEWQARRSPLARYTTRI